MSPEPIDFDDFTADDELARTIFFNRLRHNRAWNRLDLDGWDQYVTL